MNDSWDEEWEMLFQKRDKPNTLAQSIVDIQEVVEKLKHCGILLELIANRTEFHGAPFEYGLKELQKQVAYGLIDAQQIKIKVEYLNNV